MAHEILPKTISPSPEMTEAKKIRELLLEKMRKWGVKKLDEKNADWYEKAESLIRSRLDRVIPLDYVKKLYESDKERLQEIQGRLAENPDESYEKQFRMEEEQIRQDLALNEMLIELLEETQAQ